MAQYINKDALVAEIERKMNLCKQILLRSRTRQDDDYHQGNIDAYEVVISLLDTLEVKEVDMEEEFDNYANGILACDIQFEPFTHLYNCAKYFFELGLAQKGE